MRDLSRIRSLDTLPKLLALAAAQTARLVNVADLAAPFELDAAVQDGWQSGCRADSGDFAGGVR